MRKIVFTLTLFALLFELSLSAAMKDLPPLPSVGFKEKKRKALRECKVPPQIAILPPQIDADYKTCVNAYYEPDPVNVKAKIKQVGGESAKLLSVKPAQGYVRAYEIIYETKVTEKSFFSSEEKIVKQILLCDDTLKYCYKVEKIDFPTKLVKDKQ